MQAILPRFSEWQGQYAQVWRRAQVQRPRGHRPEPDPGDHGLYYFGYKLHAVCGVSGVIHSYDMTKASIHDIKYLNDVGQDYFSCTIIGDKAYLSADIQYNLFERCEHST